VSDTSTKKLKIKIVEGGIFWTKFEPTLNKILMLISNLCDCRRQTHTHPPPKTGGRAKILSPQIPSPAPKRSLMRDFAWRAFCLPRRKIAFTFFKFCVRRFFL
jgi:hypothetical protein